MSSMVLVESQWSHSSSRLAQDAAARATQIRGKAKPGYFTLRGGNLKGRQQSTSGFSVLVWQATASYVTVLEIWSKRGGGCH